MASLSSNSLSSNPVFQPTSLRQASIWDHIPRSTSITLNTSHQTCSGMVSIVHLIIALASQVPICSQKKQTLFRDFFFTITYLSRSIYLPACQSVLRTYFKVALPIILVLFSIPIFQSLTQGILLFLLRFYSSYLCTNFSNVSIYLPFLLFLFLT